MRVFWLLVVLAGCPGLPPGGGGPDASDGPGDGKPQRGGLFVDWRVNPDVPGSISETLSVSGASLQVDHLVVSGDAGAATRERYMLAWSSDGAPGQEMFLDAQVGLYSQITLQLNGGRGFGDFAYEIHGTWTDDDTSLSTQFSVRDRMPVNVNLSFGQGKTLSAGGSLTLTIKVDLKDPIEHINFKGLAGSGPIELTGQDLVDFHNRLQNAFELDNN